MSCPCGNHALKSRVAKNTQDQTTWELHFAECDRCGRIGFERLYRSGALNNQGIAARNQYQLLQDNPIYKYTDLIQQSLYRPFKLWKVGARTIHTCLIKLEERTIALCPELKLMTEGSDYLATVTELQHQVTHKLDNIDTKITVTDSTPFTLTWGTRPTSPMHFRRHRAVAGLPERPAPAADQGQGQPEPENQTSDTSNTVAPAPEPNACPALLNEDQAQLDLFAGAN